MANEAVTQESIEGKTREELIEEVISMRSRLAELEGIKTECRRLEGLLRDYAFDVSDSLRNPLQIFIGNLEGFDTSNFTPEQLNRFKNLLESSRLVERNIERLTKKSYIIDNMGHELRTPITIVKSALELAMDEEDVRERNELLMMSLNALVRQNFLVGNLIEVAKVDM
jgi:signal transduction histidine kinase